MRDLARAIATMGYVGLMWPAPGTWAALLALPLGWLAMQGGPFLFTVLTVALVPVAYWSIAAVTAGRADHDPAEVVIDEWLGQWIALLPVAWGAWAAGAAVEALWPGWVAAFLAFRLFDIWKPWVIGRLDRRNDVWGVLGDDTLAGVAAALTVTVLAGVAHL